MYDIYCLLLPDTVLTLRSKACGNKLVKKLRPLWSFISTDKFLFYFLFSTSLTLLSLFSTESDFKENHATLI